MVERKREIKGKCVVCGTYVDEQNGLKDRTAHVATAHELGDKKFKLNEWYTYPEKKSAPAKAEAPVPEEVKKPAAPKKPKASKQVTA